MNISTICFPVRDGNNFLALKKRGFGAGFLNGYGGKKEAGDSSIEATALREMKEESGVTVQLEDLEKVAVIAFFKAEQQIFECHVYFCRNWEGDFQETKEMLVAQPYDLTSPPYDKMWDADRVWVPLICAGKKIRAVSRYNEDMTKQESFQYESLL